MSKYNGPMSGVFTARSAAFALKCYLVFLVAVFLLLTLPAQAEQPQAPQESEQAPPRNEETDLDALLNAVEQDAPDSGPAGEAAQPSTKADAATAEAEPADGRAETVAKAKPGVSPLIEEIIVTANKREESLREYAGSIAAFSGKELEEMGAQSLGDYLKMEPGVSLRGEGENRGVPVIRGIAVETQVGPAQTGFTTGIFLDDVPFSDIILPVAVPDINPFDLQRIEVLKGPQGTVFGAQALGGAIRYITNKPNFDAVEANLRASYSQTSESNDNSVVYTGMLNLPVSENFALRAVLLERERAGNVDDNARGLEDVDGAEQSGGRILARWQPTERLDINVMYFEQDFDQPDQSVVDNREAFERNNTLEDQPYSAAFDATSVNAEYEFDWFSLYASINEYGKDVAFQNNTAPQLGDPGGMPPFDLIPLRNFLDVENDSAFRELRLSTPSSYQGPWRWLLGVASFKNDLHFRQTQETPLIEDNLDFLNPILALLPLLDINTDNLDLLNAEIFNLAEERSIFGSLSYTFWERLELAVAGRYFKTQLQSDSIIRGIISTVAVQELTQRGSQAVEEKGFNPAGTIKYTFNDNILAFAKAAKGFQFGGVQLIPLTFLSEVASGDAGVQTYDSSDLWNYELGTRTTWFDGRFQLDATAFFLDWTDLQLTQSDQLGLFTIITNVSKAKAKGIEAGTSLLLFDSLTLSGSATWLDAIVAEGFESAVGPVPKGTPLPGAADFQAAAILAYQLPVERFLPRYADWSATLNVGYSHIGESNNDLQQNATIGGYSTWDAGFGIEKTTGQWRPELRFQLTNFTDVRGVSSAASVAQTIPGAGMALPVSELVFLAPPRTATLTLGLKF